MTISTSVSRVDYVGNGSTTAFAVPFVFFDNTELRVVARVIATGVETVQALGTNYTVSGGDGTTGTVTATVAPASTVQWSILRDTRRTQNVDLQPNGPLPAETLEQALDRVVAIVQEIERDQLRSIRAAETDSTADLTLPTQGQRASRILGFDLNGKPVPVLPEAGTLAATPYAQTILSAGDAATARSALGSTSVGDAVFVAASAAVARVALGATTTGAALFTALDAAAARTAIGATTTGSAVLTAADAAAGRAAIGAAAVAQTGSGVGQFLSVAPGIGNAAVLPAGGQWKYSIIQNNAGTGVITNAAAGITTGGSTIGTAGTGLVWSGWVERIA